MKRHLHLLLPLAASLAALPARADTLVRFDFWYATSFDANGNATAASGYPVYADIYSQPATTTNNFLTYVNDNAYNDSIIHRNYNDIVLQGGGFDFTSYTSIGTIPTLAPIPLQYTVPNTRGTIAFARTPDPNSATSQFFFNVADNSALWAPGGADPYGYAVFGSVLNATSMSFVDQMTALGVYDKSANLNGNFAALPLTQNNLSYNYFIHLQDVANLGLIGDLNGDGKVNIDDFLTFDDNYLHHNSGWGRNNFAGFALGDLNLDGTIDGQDYALLLNAYAESTSGTLGTPNLTASPIPEPASLLFLTLASASLLRRRR